GLHIHIRRPLVRIGAVAVRRPGEDGITADRHREAEYVGRRAVGGGQLGGLGGAGPTAGRLDQHIRRPLAGSDGGCGGGGPADARRAADRHRFTEAVFRSAIRGGQLGGLGGAGPTAGRLDEYIRRSRPWNEVVVVEGRTWRSDDHSIATDRHRGTEG